jgi:hypothetical protein
LWFFLLPGCHTLVQSKAQPVESALFLIAVSLVWYFNKLSFGESSIATDVWRAFDPAHWVVEPHSMFHCVGKHSAEHADGPSRRRFASVAGDMNCSMS